MPRPCSICPHEDRDAIEGALSSGTPFRNIASHFQVSASAVFRHKQHTHRTRNGGPLNSRGLTLKQQKFVKAYIEHNGNGRAAAESAGYRASSPQALSSMAAENLQKPVIRQELERTLGKIMDKTEILQELSEVSRSQVEIKGHDKLKALELLGKTHKMFTDKIEQSNLDARQSAEELISEVRERYSLSREQAAQVVEEAYGVTLPPLTSDLVQ